MNSVSSPPQSHDGYNSNSPSLPSPPSSPFPLVQSGSLIILYGTPLDLYPIIVTPGSTFQSKYGSFSHSKMIGKTFGSKVFSTPTQKNPYAQLGFLYMLRPTPSLWTKCLSHRTQILYLADIAFIISYLNIRPGSFVYESGTGSGSLSTAITHSLCDTQGLMESSRDIGHHIHHNHNGHLLTFEFNSSRVEKAREDFYNFQISLPNSSDPNNNNNNNVSLSSSVTCIQRDIVTYGFPSPYELFSEEMIQNMRKRENKNPKNYLKFDLDEEKYSLKSHIDKMVIEEGGVFTRVNQNSEETQQSASISSPPSSFPGVDAVVLDLPSPWVVIPSVFASLRDGGRLCSFSPCIEQVQRFCSILSSIRIPHEDAAKVGKFVQIRTFEVLIREFQAKKHEEHRGKGKEQEKKENEKGKERFPAKREREREEKENEKNQKEKKIKVAKPENESENDNANDNENEKEENNMEDEEDQTNDQDNDITMGEDKEKDDKAISTIVPISIPSLPSVSSSSSSSPSPIPSPSYSTFPLPNSRGHTGYLTFAIALKPQ